MDEDEKELRKAKVMAVSAIILEICGFASFVGAAVMQKRGIPDSIILPVVVIAFFGCSFAAIFLLIKAAPELMTADIKKIDRKYDSCRPEQLAGMDKQSIRQKLLQHKFLATEEGYYRKRKFSFLKDSVSYYVRITEDVNLQTAINREMDRFDKISGKGKNFCLILFVNMDAVGEREIESLKQAGKTFIAMETVLNPNLEETVIPVLIDQNSDTGFFLDIGKGHIISLYSHGCKMLKKIWRKQ